MPTFLYDVTESTYAYQPWYGAGFYPKHTKTLPYQDIIPLNREYSFSGFTQIEGVNSACMIYIFNTKFEQIDNFISNSDGTYESRKLPKEGEYHIVCVPLDSNECPQITNVVVPTGNL